MHMMRCIVVARPQAWRHCAHCFLVHTTVVLVSSGARSRRPQAPCIPTFAHGVNFRPRVVRGMIAVNVCTVVRGVLGGGLSLFCSCHRGAIYAPRIDTAPLHNPLGLVSLAVFSFASLGCIVSFSTFSSPIAGAPILGCTVNPLPSTLKVEPTVAPAPPRFPPPFAAFTRGTRLGGEGGHGGGCAVVLPLTCGLPVHSLFDISASCGPFPEGLLSAAPQYGRSRVLLY
jgi:hypothetical protein